MLEGLADLVLDEGKWLTAAMAASLIALLPFLRRHRERAWDRATILGALNRFYGCTIGVMGSGHLLAISVSGARGTLRGSPVLLCLIGLVIAVPAWLLFHAAERVARGEQRWNSRAAVLDAWLAVALLALGIHNLPLAVPAALNLGYHLHRRPAVGWGIVAVAVVVNAVLFTGSLVFLASGQSFEEFSGM